MTRTADAGADSPVWRRAGSAAYVDSADRAAVLDLDHLDLPPYVLEGTAGAIWAGIDGVRSEAEIVLRLSQDYGVEPEVVAADVRAFVERLAGLGLLVAVAPVAGDPVAGD